MKKISFDGSILLLGCGAVSKCLQKLIADRFAMDFSKVVIMDKVDCTNENLLLVEKGARFIHQTFQNETFGAILAQYLKPGDILIDLATDIITLNLIDWCQKNEVLFINTSLEWPSTFRKQDRFNEMNTIYAHHVELSGRAKIWGQQGPTAVIEHGANPGLVSHWSKQALEDISQLILKRGTQAPRARAIEIALEEENHPELAQLTGTKVIHISERDTQITRMPKRVNEFVNTWSVVGLYEEAMLPAELGWGTHEKQIESLVISHTKGEGNQVYLNRLGMDTYVYSWVPAGPIIGSLISHGEAYTISEHLTVWYEGKVEYRPSVYFVYLTSDATIASIYEAKMNNYQLQDSIRIMSDDIIDGHDQMGVLLLGHDFNGWWTGSTLDIHTTRSLIGTGYNATTLQVAASMLGALSWMIANPRKGLCMPDDLPHKEILEIANPYLGTLTSAPTSWRSPSVTEEPTWRLDEFLVPR